MTDNALQVVLTPDPCGPWPSRLPEFKPTLLQQIGHALCEAEHGIANLASDTFATARAWANWLWQRLGDLWDATGGALIREFENEAASLWQDVQDFNRWVYGMLGTTGKWMIGAAAVALALLFLPEIAAVGAVYSASRSK